MTNESTQLLIVDDERTNINALGAILSPKYQVSVALNAKQAFTFLQNNLPLPELILLDVMMPEVDGYQVCQQLKQQKQYQHIPVIFISALTDPLDKVKGLKAGAVDFISKPFNDQEVLARVATHIGIAKKQQQLIENNSELKRLNQFKNNNNNFSVDDETFKVSYQDKTIELTHLEFNLFYLLYQQPERIYSRNQILDLAYPDMRNISDRAVDAHVKNIRNKIKRLNISVSVIESVYGAGYRYIAPA